MRALWLVMGGLSLGLGILGIVLPLLPTVPFILLAAFCFARSSSRLHDWLLAHPRFGPVIHDWRRSGAIRPRVKKISTASVIAVLGISFATGVSLFIIIIQVVTLTLVMIFIWTRPNE